ncbi:MAG: glycoside hydrolase family 2 protein [Bacteroidota bacterium]|nr:glycoside hydrolase family 2 protein [Bacteroidota bacterium]
MNKVIPLFRKILKMNFSTKAIKLFLSLFLSFFILSGCNDSDKSEIKIKTFSSWQYKGVDNTWRKAYIPESVQNSLIRDTFLKNLFFGDNFLKNNWTDTVAWTYKSSIFINRTYSDSRFDLNISNLVGVADVFLNDTLIYRCDNMFTDYKKDVSDFIKRGNNNLVIKFLSHKNAKKIAQDICEFTLPLDGQEMIRLPFFYFDTTAGIRYLPIGINKIITLTKWNKAIIRNVNFKATEIKDNDYAIITATYTIEAAKRINIELEITGQNKYYFKSNVRLKKGLNKYVCKFKIKNPKLWWTHDLGEPHLYKFKTKISNGNDKIHEIGNFVGIRTIEIDTTYHKFSLKLNNVPLVLKIFDYVSPELFYENINNSDYHSYVKDFVLANANMVHVKENGKYENEIFYRECDKQGILVWQDFMLPYKILNPTDKMLEKIKIEATQNIKKLRNHPCIAFWSGQNFFAQYYKKYAYNLKQDSIIISEYNQKIFKRLLPNLLKIYNPEAYYFEKMNFSSIVNITDKHPEYPHINTIRKISSAKDRKIGKRILKLHQRPLNSDSTISNHLANEFGIVPKDITAFLYLNYLHKKNYFEKKIMKQRFNPNFNGFIVGNYRDFSPIVSTSAVDYNGYWKGKMYGIKYAFKPVIFNIIEKKGWVYIEINSDLNTNIETDFYFKLSDFNGKVHWRRNFLSTVISGKLSRRYFSFNLSRELSKIGKNNAVFKIEVFHKQELFAEKYFLFVPEKNQNLKEPKLNQKMYIVDNGYVIEYSTNHFTNSIYIYTDKDGIIDHNFFALSPGDTKKINFITSYNVYSVDKAFLAINFTDRNKTNMFVFRKK